MKNTLSVLIPCSFLLLPILLAAQPQPIGWASLNGGTIGGYGGTVVMIDNRADLITYAANNEPYILLISDTIDLVLYERITVRSNKTLFGITENAMIRYGGFEIKGDNVIVQNLIIGDFYDGDWSGVTHSTDALTLYGENIWIDHCWLYAGADGLLDIRSDGAQVADYITVSYSRFSNHNKVTLVGSSDNSTQDRGHLRVTFHHNWYDGTYARGINQRMPRVRFGDVHVFNNYYEEIGSYCIAARFESDVVVESTYFRNSTDPHIIDDLGKGMRDPNLVSINNIYELCSGSETTRGDAFVPADFYDYEPDPTWNIPAIVMNEAGPMNPSNNSPPVAFNDTIDYSGMSGGLFIYPTTNDLDAEGKELRLAQLANSPPGIGFIKDNSLIYAPPSDAEGVDSIKYTVVDTDGGLDTGLILIFYDGLSPVNDRGILHTGLDIYPNPADDLLQFELNDNSVDEVALELFDSTGMKVLGMQRMHANGNRFKVDISTLKNGVFVLLVTADGKKYAQQFVVLK